MGAKPFIKWAGGKGSLLSQLDSLLPANFSDLDNVMYVEPFVGGGAMLFYMLQHYKNIKRVVINDINPDLIHCYKLVKDNPERLIALLRPLDIQYNKKKEAGRRSFYYKKRKEFNSCEDPDERAALFIFLNHTCYNGLFRVNRAGKFNVPHGRYKHPSICNVKVIMEDHKLLTSIDSFIRPPGDYKHIERHLGAKCHKFVYLDPPYRPLTVTSYFTEYSNIPFGDREQEELKLFCDRLTRRGCQIMQSNSDSMGFDGTSYFEQLYAGYHFERILAHRYINAVPEGRIKLTELIITNY